MNDYTSSNKNASVITNYFAQFHSAFHQLGKSVPLRIMEELAISAVRAMGSESRDYHKPEHSLDVSKDQTPLARLAAIFHDIIYVQVDPTWKVNFQTHLGVFMPDLNVKLNALEGFSCERSKLRRAIIILFGMEQNQEVVVGKGLNEVLSALVMEHMLSPYLTTKEILSVAACIEATIPFRKIDADGKTSADRLKIRIQRAAQFLGVEFTEEDILNVVDWCRRIVEKDLASFGSHKLNTFMSNTWNVMNENNPSLRNTFFLVSEYRKAVYSVIPFLKSLDPEQMFWNEPGSLDIALRTLTENTYRNLKLGVDYLATVGLSLSLIEALSLETGGDIPYETMVGATRKSREHIPLSIDAFLPAKDPRSLTEGEAQVYLLMKNGRELRTRFDRKDCALGAYLFQSMSYESLFKLYDLAQKFHKGEVSGTEFLSNFPDAVLFDVIDALARTATIRAIQLIHLKESFLKKKFAA